MKINYTSKPDKSKEEFELDLLRMFKYSQASIMCFNQELLEKVIKELYKSGYQNIDTSIGSTCKNMIASTKEYVTIILAKKSYKDGSYPLKGRVIMYGVFDKSTTIHLNHPVMIHAQTLLDNIDIFNNLPD